MNILHKYIERQQGIPFSIPDQHLKGPSIFIVIPCYNEPDIISTLNSLAQCDRPGSTVSVLIVVNDAEDSGEVEIAQNHRTLGEIEEWKHCQDQLFYNLDVIYAYSLPTKWAGVGQARKIGMDNALIQLVKNGLIDGIIVSLDADSAVSANYLQAIENCFSEHPLSNFFTIHFEHQIHNPELSPVIREGIVRYELHMRYFRNAMAWIGYPNAIYTVGSSFAVRASAYARQGGMNRRKAGEDFYFLHKLVFLGEYGNIGSATVFPSSRESDRVPFGTGAAIKKWIEGEPDLKSTYSLEAFCSLKPFFAMVGEFWTKSQRELAILIEKLRPSLQLFCENMQTLHEIAELKKNCSNQRIFEKRFFHLLNAFWILKYLNFAHESGFDRGDLQGESAKLIYLINNQEDGSMSLENLLVIYRNLDKGIQNCV
jgi:glycosyltransferase involved in cell wall biosynthesis